MYFIVDACLLFADHSLSEKLMSTSPSLNRQVLGNISEHIPEHIVGRKQIGRYLKYYDFVIYVGSRE